MKALRRKLKSRRGASILLALLFFLLCMMVGASVLAAAASNAGRIKSNKEEQQKYLTLSSAVNLLIDELESVEYVGLYTYTPQPCTHYVPDASGSITLNADGIYSEVEGGPGGYSRAHVNDYQYEQDLGALRHRTDTGSTLPAAKDDWTGGLNGVLPLNNDFDDIFAKNFEVPGKGEEDGYFCKPLGGTYFNGYYILELAAVPTAGNDYGALTGDKVRVEVTLRTDGSIKLIATLWEKAEIADPSGGDPTVTWEKSDYTMEALLRPDPVDDWAEKRLVLPESPTLQEPDGTYRTDPIQWKLEYIFKKEADPSATPAPT